MRAVNSSNLTKELTSNRGAPTKMGSHNNHIRMVHTRVVLHNPIKQEDKSTRRTCMGIWMRCLQVQVQEEQEGWTRSWESYTRMLYLPQGE